ncbi:hypothetical protein BD626DRAFT_577389 [Schizophyllum amplum]|uniref:Uncharacterized protein n=1 Tax=Schizophyllum amplum TaxID=97359 RepID=A0A550BSK7_9AGAR|nr:hypothetical protein BD626DRAFT_577389 [Auriculariopsis ampla]
MDTDEQADNQLVSTWAETSQHSFADALLMLSRGNRVWAIFDKTFSPGRGAKERAIAEGICEKEVEDLDEEDRSSGDERKDKAMIAARLRPTTTPAEGIRAVTEALNAHVTVLAENTKTLTDAMLAATGISEEMVMASRDARARQESVKARGQQS